MGSYSSPWRLLRGREAKIRKVRGTDPMWGLKKPQMKPAFYSLHTEWLWGWVSKRFSRHMSLQRSINLRRVMPSTLQSGLIPDRCLGSSNSKTQDAGQWLSVRRRHSFYTINTFVTLNAINKRSHTLCLQCVSQHSQCECKLLTCKAAQPPCQLFPCLLEKSLYQSQCVWLQQLRKGIKQQSVSMSLCIPAPLANLK